MAGDAPKAAFDMGRMAMGGFGQMLDGVEFVKRAWSSTLNLPGSLVPTVDIDELDKRIADLKAVEQWLNVNLGMLRGTVQALEVQRGTLAAIRAFGASLDSARPGAEDTEAAATLRRAMAEIAARSSAAAAAAAAPPAPPAAPAAAPVVAAPPDPSAATAAPAPGPGGSAPASRDAASRTRTRSPARADAPAAPVPPALPAINPGAWWNLLQQNFNQVAEAALSGVGLQGPGTPKAADGAAPRTARQAGSPAQAAQAAQAARGKPRGKAAPAPAPAPARRPAARKRSAAVTRPTPTGGWPPSSRSRSCRRGRSARAGPTAAAWASCT
jgi:hypothetical protein